MRERELKVKLNWKRLKGREQDTSEGEELSPSLGRIKISQHYPFRLSLLPSPTQIFDDIIFAFFALEMTIKMVAMGMCGKNTYLADSWNRLDFFIVLAGLLEYVMHVENLNLTAIRTIRVLRPLRAINRIPSECCHPHMNTSRFVSMMHLPVPLFFRYANSRDATPRHAAHARECPLALFLCVLHLWHHWGAAVAGYSATALHTGSTRRHDISHNVSSCGPARIEGGDSKGSRGFPTDDPLR